MFNGKIHSNWPCSIAMWLFTRPGKIHALYVWPYGHTYKRSTVGTSLWQGVQVRGQLRHCLRGCWVYGYVIIIIMIMSIQYLIHIWYIYMLYVWYIYMIMFIIMILISIIITTIYYDLSLLLLLLLCMYVWYMLMVSTVTGCNWAIFSPLGQASQRHPSQTGPLPLSTPATCPPPEVS